MYPKIGGGVLYLKIERVAKDRDCTQIKVYRKIEGVSKDKGCMQSGLHRALLL